MGLYKKKLAPAANPTERALGRWSSLIMMMGVARLNRDFAHLASKVHPIGRSHV